MRGDIGVSVNREVAVELTWGRGGGGLLRG